jgi:hypothetical protein
MRLDDEQESSNFEIQQGGGGGFGGGFGGGNLLGFLLPMIGSRFGCWRDRGSIAARSQ